METEEKQDMGGVIIGLVSFCSSIISIFVMYYIFAALSLITGFLGLSKKNSKAISIVSIVIVGITFIIKLLGILLEQGILTDALTKGLL